MSTTDVYENDSAERRASSDAPVFSGETVIVDGVTISPEIVTMIRENVRKTLADFVEGIEGKIPGGKPSDFMVTEREFFVNVQQARMPREIERILGYTVGGMAILRFMMAESVKAWKSEPRIHSKTMMEAAHI
jgi:hypothetical protein